ncbi:integrase, partial [Klebsiella quasipneumoniae]
IEMVRRYAHLAPNHLTEHARKIEAIFVASDTNTTQGGNQAGLKLT